MPSQIVKVKLDPEPSPAVAPRRARVLPRRPTDMSCASCKTSPRWTWAGRRATRREAVHRRPGVRAHAGQAVGLRGRAARQARGGQQLQWQAAVGAGTAGGCRARRARASCSCSTRAASGSTWASRPPVSEDAARGQGLQAEARGTRMGGTTSLQIVQLLMRGTIEERCMRRSTRSGSSTAAARSSGPRGGGGGVEQGEEGKQARLLSCSSCLAGARKSRPATRRAWRLEKAKISAGLRRLPVGALGLLGLLGCVWLPRIHSQAHYLSYSHRHASSSAIHTSRYVCAFRLARSLEVQACTDHLRRVLSPSKENVASRRTLEDAEFPPRLAARAIIAQLILERVRFVALSA